MKITRAVINGRRECGQLRKRVMILTILGIFLVFRTSDRNVSLSNELHRGKVRRIYLPESKLRVLGRQTSPNQTAPYEIKLIKRCGLIFIVLKCVNL